MNGPHNTDPHYLSPLEEARLECEAFRALAVQRGRAFYDTRVALQDLVEIINAAGLLNLTNGVQLGATSWYVKAAGRMGEAQLALNTHQAPEGNEP